MKPTEKHEPLACPRCKDLFVCNPYNIANCNCSKVELSHEETEFINKQFNDCVCNKCLLELKSVGIDVQPSGK